MSGFETPWMDLLFAIRKLRPDFNNAKMREERLKHLAELQSQIIKNLDNRVQGECASLRKEHPWLEEFETTGSWLSLGADNEFIEKPTDMVHTLILYTDRWLGERTAWEFGRVIGQVVERTVGSSVQDDGAQPQDNAASVDEKNPNQVTEPSSRANACGKVYRDYFSDAEFAGEICGIWKSSKETAYTGTRPMSNFPAKAVKFAHKHGISPSVEDPLDCLQMLEKKVVAMRVSGGGREAQLQDEITRLREERDKAIVEKEAAVKERDEQSQKVREYKAAINHLAYRHLMESLPIPLPSGKHGPAWQAFWQDAMTKAKNGKPGPVKNLLDNLPKSIWHSQIEADGKSLYGTYSVNIHGFAGGKGIYEVDPSTISNLAERLIVQALKPDPTNFTADGDVEWAKERARFI